MPQYIRSYEKEFAEKIRYPRVHILFGARQTGKSTLVRKVLPQDALVFNLSNPAERLRFLQNPSELIFLCRALPQRKEPWYIFIDEVQLIPDLLNAVQVLYDENPERYRFILCGSSARKLRTTGANLLPGRSILHSLYPLTSLEYAPAPSSNLPIISLLQKGSLLEPLQTDVHRGDFPFRDLEDRLLFGDLPGIATIQSPEERREVLHAYVAIHLEEEIRRESAKRDFGLFLRFLKFSASESGGILNLQAVSKESGLSGPTIRSHYQLLEGMFLGFMVPAFSRSTRKSILSSPKFFFFDLGVRNAALGLELTPDAVRVNPGPLFEHWVGVELYKRLQYLKKGTLSYFRTHGGMEIDFIIESGERFYPIEVKWTERPTLQDARHLMAFMKMHPERTPHGYVVCRCPYPLSLTERITAIPYWGV